jgi:hypothetical protein
MTDRNICTAGAGRSAVCRPAAAYFHRRTMGDAS